MWDEINISIQLLTNADFGVCLELFDRNFILQSSPPLECVCVFLARLANTACDASGYKERLKVRKNYLPYALR